MPVASLPSQREIAAVVFRRKWLVLGAFLAPLAACVAAPFLMTPVYEAEARLLVKAGREFIPSADGPSGAQTSPQSTMREIVDTVVQILTSVDLAQDVVRELTVARLYPKIANAVPPALHLPALRLPALGPPALGPKTPPRALWSRTCASPRSG